MPTPAARGPWSADMLHGRFLGGLGALALEEAFGRDEFRVSRLTVDLFRPSGLELVEVATTLVREGRRIIVADAVLSVGEHDVASVRAVFLKQGEPPPGEIWQADPWDVPAPEAITAVVDPDDRAGSPSAWDVRVISGGIQSSGRSRLWTKDSAQLVAGETLSPLVRAAVTSDIASPMSNGSDVGLGYINADYTLAMSRYSTGEWVGLETTTHLASDGIALGAATLYDVDGPFGTSTATALANPIL